jgi:putative hydrolase of the HAD superfamily
MLKALIFDFDGLILDTETPEYYAINEVYAEFGYKLPIATFGLTVGSQYNDKYEPVQHLQGLTGKQLDADFFWQKVHRRRVEMIEQNPILPGVEDLIQEGKARGLKLAVASSSPHKWVDGYLIHYNLFRYFDVIKCKEDVLNVKPEPDLFLAALNALQVKADEAVIFEDSLNGVIAAQRAGIRVIAIPNPVTEHMNIVGETLRLRSMKDMSLNELMKKL